MNIVITTHAKKDLEKLDSDTRKRVYIALEHLFKSISSEAESVSL